VEVDFFGGRANVAEGTAVFARQTGVPIFPTIPIREGIVRHRIKILDPIWPDPSLEKKEDIRRLTQATLTAIEAEIRKRPELWFWYNKRWILDPVDAP
jgi:KDO2-lipid IV(A) lauroyltransferase